MLVSIPIAVTLNRVSLRSFFFLTESLFLKQASIIKRCKNYYKLQNLLNNIKCEHMLKHNLTWFFLDSLLNCTLLRSDKTLGYSES